MFIDICEEVYVIPLQSAPLSLSFIFVVSSVLPSSPLKQKWLAMFQPLNNTTESVVLCCYLPENCNNTKYYLAEEAQRVKYIAANFQTKKRAVYDYHYIYGEVVCFMWGDY